MRSFNMAVLVLATAFSMSASAAGFQMRVQKPGLKPEPPKVEEPAPEVDEPIEGEAPAPQPEPVRGRFNIAQHGWSDIYDGKKYTMSQHAELRFDGERGTVSAHVSWSATCLSTQCKFNTTPLVLNDADGVRIAILERDTVGMNTNHGSLGGEWELAPGVFELVTDVFRIRVEVDSSLRPTIQQLLLKHDRMGYVPTTEAPATAWVWTDEL